MRPPVCLMPICWKKIRRICLFIIIGRSIRRKRSNWQDAVKRRLLIQTKRISNSEGASVSVQHSHFVLANSDGFMGGYPYSSHSLSVAPIAASGDSMQRDYWYTASRDPAELKSPEDVGRYAAKRALARLNARQIGTRKCPVLFEAPVAIGLINSFVYAVSGSSLYRKSSFLPDALGKRIFPEHIGLLEDPHLKGAMDRLLLMMRASGRAAAIVGDGIVNGYFLSSYSARKLGMKTTGNAGGSHNLVFSSRLTEAADDFAGMLKKMETGLVVTELMGQGINYVTGDYSRGASGFWVENGVIQYPVQEITIAGNLREMFGQIVAGWCGYPDPWCQEVGVHTDRANDHRRNVTMK